MLTSLLYLLMHPGMVYMYMFIYFGDFEIQSNRAVHKFGLLHIQCDTVLDVYCTFGPCSIVHKLSSLQDVKSSQCHGCKQIPVQHNTVNNGNE